MLQKREPRMLKAVRYRVQKFPHVDDSGWIPLERVTAFVGRNESGKTASLSHFTSLIRDARALHPQTRVSARIATHGIQKRS